MSFISDILEVKQNEINRIQKRFTKNDFESFGYFNKVTKDIRSVLNPGSFGIIAEIKKASPSKGILIKDFDHRAIYNNYRTNGADAVSVLTETHFFHGDIQYLEDLAQISDIPLLRKDFIIDELQIFQTKAIGADIILLICEILSKQQITDFTDIAMGIGLKVLLEFHSEKEMEKIDFDRNKLIGINSRDLFTFEEDLGKSIKISEKLPESIFRIAESGLREKKDFIRVKQAGFGALLAGEIFMRSHNIGDKLSEVRSWCDS
ncbi:MAG: indole-3-glycerol phosphate synthase TrpC [Ignavibacteriales bacterium]|nr:indole-3-glycerol phosphate synthase TrpC [Ignavibacteriales bacterium]